MTTIEMIIGGIGILIAMVAGAFGIGHSKGKSTAEQKANERETEIKLEAERTVRQRQATVSKEASDVKSNVSRMRGSAVDDELRSDWINKG